MKPIILHLATAALLASFTAVQAQVDTVATYDENLSNTATIGAFLTNHPLGYAGFITDIATAWNNDEGGVIDEFSPSGLHLNFGGSSFTTGYGITGIYDPTTMTAAGPSITFDVPNYNWDLGTNGANASPAISLDYFMILSGSSIDQNITMVTSPSVNVTEIGFTVLNTNTDLITASAYFSDGTKYVEDFQTKGVGNTFFGAVAPVGESILYFKIGNVTGNKIFIDDLAFSTAVPEASTLGFAVLGLAFAARRRRCA